MPEITPPEGPSELAPTGELKTGTLGRYRILGELGRGGCGVVYRALDPSIGRMVAIKTILTSTEGASGLQSRERFRREARSAGNLSHPNIVTVHDFNDSGDPMFIAMEFVEGRTLAAAMSSGPLSVDFILGVLRSAANALDYAHAQHIVHRDIKPANFLIDKDGRLKITDFGIAKILDNDEVLTSTGMLVGTAQYMSPEQVSEAPVTGRSDQFSLAVIAYEMLTGEKPFQGNSWASVIHAIVMSEPPPIVRYRGGLSAAMDSVLRKALAKDPHSRYKTCSEFCDAFEREIAGVTAERTAIFDKTHTPIAAAPIIEPHTNQESLRQREPGNSNSTLETLPLIARKRPVMKPVLVGAVGGAVIAVGLWVALRSRPVPSATPLVVRQADSVSRPVEPPPSDSKSPPPPKPEASPAPRVAKTAAKQTDTAPPAVRVTVSQPLSSTDNQKPVEIIPVPPPKPVAQAPVPAPVRPPEDQTKRLADEQTKRAADEQAKRLADEQTRRAADEQSRRLAEEQLRNVRAAENTAISVVLRTYQDAYERKDWQALQRVWPSIPKQSLDGIRNSFRDASEVTMNLRALSEPKISGAVATVLCDRNLRQVILKRVLQASGRVRVVLVRSGAGWIIQSVDPVNE